MDLIDAQPDRFGGVITNSDALPSDPEVFKPQLQQSLDTWAAEGFKAVWLEIPNEKVALVPVAVDSGFSYHHAVDSRVLLTRPLVDGAYIPPYATHYIGVGGVVLNDAEELLVVSERYRRGTGPSYKLPGGALLPGEHIVDAALREVLEETGVETRFESLACFRHWHGYRYGKSDIYFVCRLSPLSQEITPQAEEIAECLWMPVGRYLDSETVSEFNKRIVRAALENPGVVTTTVDGYGTPETHEFFMPNR
jgi:8-oxo-dGTP pyrophosphatase MutT (NUDIX family)